MSRSEASILREVLVIKTEHRSGNVASAILSFFDLISLAPMAFLTRSAQSTGSY